MLLLELLGYNSRCGMCVHMTFEVFWQPFLKAVDGRILDRTFSQLLVNGFFCILILFFFLSSTGLGGRARSRYRICAPHLWIIAGGLPGYCIARVQFLIQGYFTRLNLPCIAYMLFQELTKSKQYALPNQKTPKIVSLVSYHLHKKSITISKYMIYICKVGC